MPFYLEDYMKIGDKIRCIDDSKQNVLKEGHVYTVMGIDRENRVYIQEYKRFSFLKDRFVVEN